MSAQQAADAVKDAVSNVADKVSQLTTGEGSAAGGTQPNLLKDDVTGEMVSKTELKKRQKQREKDAKKAERDANKTVPPASKRKAGAEAEDESQLNPNVSQWRRMQTYIFQDMECAIESRTS